MASKQAIRRRNAKQNEQTRDVLDYRAFNVRSATVDTEHRSIEAVIASETPVPEFDWERYEVVPRVLLASGVVMPSGDQMPLLDSHNRWSTENQLGSIRNLRRENGNIVGRLFFSSVAEDAWTKVREGHVTDVSAGFRVHEETYVPRGQTQKIDGRDFTGPVNVATKWGLREGSITPIGADEMAKMRGLDASNLPPSLRKEFAMTEELRALCVERGMDAKLSDDEAQRWMVDNFKAPEKKAEERKEEPAKETLDFSQARADKLVADAIAKHEASRATFRKEVDAMCELADVQDFARDAYDLGSIDKVREAILARKKEASPNVPGAPIIRFGAAQKEKHRGAVGSALNLRALQATGASQKTIDAVFPVEGRDKQAHEFRNASLLDMARECLEMDGFATRGLTREQIAMAALGFPHQANLRADAGYHTTGSFVLLTADAVNKSLQAGYQEFPATWRGPMRQAASVPDFKTISRVRLGAIPNIPIWPDNADPEKASFADAREQYAVEARSVNVSFSWRLLVNDDMDALSRTPSQLGQACSRTVNAVAWAQITANPALSDGIALFAAATGARKRTNLTTGAGVPSVTTLQTLGNLMQQMRGENTPDGNEGSDILNLQPRYIVGPSALSTTIKQLVLSAYDPAATNHLTYNTATELVPVIEPLLDANSAKAWYLFASPGQIDTVEVTFLQGQESPVTRSWSEEKNLAQNWTVLQTFAAKAMNHRGIQKHAGE